MNVLESSEDVDFGIRKNNSCSACVFDREFGFAVFACDTSDGSAQMLTLKGLDIFDLCGVQN